MKHIVLYSILGLFISSMLSVGSAWGATDCWFEFTCTRSDPARIEYCSDGRCTVQDGSNAASSAVGTLLSRKPIHVFVGDTVRYFLSFITLISVVFFLYAGFQLMTSGGDEEKAKKTRKIMIYVIAGIVLMWMAYWLVLIVINSLT